MKRFFLLLMIIVGFVSLSFAQDEPSVKPQQPSFESPHNIVRAIEIIGNRSISTNTIISKMKTRIGSEYSENIVSDDIKRLYLLGFFSDISVDVQDFRDGVKIVLTVIERPLIEKISFEDVRRLYLKEEKLKEKLKSKEKQYLDYPKLKDDVETIKKLYEKKGYPDTQIEYKVDIDKEKNKAKITFLVQEAKRIRIKNILIEGNKSYPAKRILKLMKTKRAWLLNSGVLKESVFQEDIKRIESFYRREGFTDVKVDYNIREHPKKPLIYIDVKIEEGKRYTVGKISIQGNVAIQEQDLRSVLVESLEGGVFSQEAIKRDIANIQGVYFERGYIFARVEEGTSLNPKTGLVDIVYNITENEIAYINKIKVRGNIKTKDIVIRRELRIYPGERFDGGKIRRSKERLQNLGFFEEISYDTEDTDVSNIKDLVVEVKESKTGTFSFGGGYSTVD